MRYELPLKLVSLTNTREHWAKKARRAKRERMAAIVIRKHPLPCTVTIKRHGKRRMDDDNLRAAAKSLRDGIADRLGVDDADPRVAWRYAQDAPAEYRVTVTIEDRA